MQQNVRDVLVIGAGPVRLTMAAELARHGVRCRIVDRLLNPSRYCRAIGITPRTLEVWDDIAALLPEVADRSRKRNAVSGKRKGRGWAPPYSKEIARLNGRPQAAVRLLIVK
jgi:2-polyprenyl-6-methoxyphenol hydroxylase-like FAD-dependent oxidoreductase